MGGLCDEGGQSRKADEMFIFLCCSSCSIDAENTAFPVESVSTQLFSPELMQMLRKHPLSFCLIKFNLKMNPKTQLSVFRLAVN